MLTKLFAETFPVLSVNKELCLRQPDTTDADSLCGYYTDSDVGKYVLATDPDTLDEAKAELQYNRNLFRTRRGLFWSLAKKDTDEMIGSVGLYTNNFHHRAELCYELAKPYWSKGLMTEALIPVLDYCFGEADFMRLEAVTMVDNEASQALLKKCGFEFDALMKNYRYYEGKFFDVNMYSITPDAWKAYRATLIPETSTEADDILEEFFA